MDEKEKLDKSLDSIGDQIDELEKRRLALIKKRSNFEYSDVYQKFVWD